MVFDWSWSDSKSFQVSRTLLSILTDLDTAIVWMILRSPSIFNFSRPTFQAFVDCSNRANYKWYHHHLHVLLFSYFFCKVKLFVSLLVFLYFLSAVYWDGKIHYTANSLSFFFFFFLLLINISSGRD